LKRYEDALMLCDSRSEVSRLRILMAIGQSDRAFQECKEWLRRLPDNTKLRKEFALIHLVRGQYEEAIQLSKELHDPSTLDFYGTSLVGAIALSGRREEYQESCAAILKHLPQDDPVKTAIGARCCILLPNATPDADQVLEAVKLSAEARPGVTWVHHTLGMAYFRANKYDEARRSIEHSLKVGPRWRARYLNWYALALIDWNRGDKESAVNWYAKASSYTDDLPYEVFYTSGDWMECQLLQRECRGLFGE
jgi:tetratricopeptide (TPR) repeat protein